MISGNTSGASLNVVKTVVGVLKTTINLLVISSTFHLSKCELRW